MTLHGQPQNSSAINGHLSPVLRDPLKSLEFLSHNGDQENGVDGRRGMFLNRNKPRHDASNSGMNGALYTNGEESVVPTTTSSPDPISLLRNLQIEDANLVSPSHEN